jgi:site-specific DNA-methyltransferase (adenine-specific)
MKYYPQKTKLDKPKKLFVKMYGTRNSTIRNGHTIRDAGNKEYTERHPTSIKTVSNANMSKKKFHPTQKPEELLEWLIKSYTLEDEIVLDNVMGSGSTGVTCKRLNRKFIGIEKEKEYFNIALKRINE